MHELSVRSIGVRFLVLGLIIRGVASLWHWSMIG